MEDPQQAGVDVRSHLLRYYRQAAARAALPPPGWSASSSVRVPCSPPLCCLRMTPACLLTDACLCLPNPPPTPARRREQYSAERMNLVVLGGDPLDTLQQWAAELFSGMPGGRGPAPEFGSVGFPFQVRGLGSRARRGWVRRCRWWQWWVRVSWGVLWTAQAACGLLEGRPRVDRGLLAQQLALLDAR